MVYRVVDVQLPGEGERSDANGEASLSGDAESTGGASVITETDALVEKGKKQGYVTYADILELLPEAA